MSPFNPNKAYQLVVVREVMREVARSPRLQLEFPWFADADLVDDREARCLRFSKQELISINDTKRFLLDWVADNAATFVHGKRRPPGEADCFVLAVAMERALTVATDDEGMVLLAEAMEISIVRCCDVLHKLWSAKRVQTEEVVAIYCALHGNGDLPAYWRLARTTLFAKIAHRLADEVLVAGVA